MFNIGKMKSNDGAGSGSTTLSTTSASAAVGIVVTMAEKHLGTNMGTSLRKHSKRAAPEEPVDASRSTTKALAEKGMEPVGRGKEPTKVEEVSEQGYSIRELCEVEDQAGANRYFTSIMTRLKINEGEDPLALRWLSISGSTWVWTKGPLAGEYLRGALQPILAKQLYEYSSEELMNRAVKSIVWIGGVTSVAFSVMVTVGQWTLSIANGSPLGVSAEANFAKVLALEFSVRGI
ncbi:hypothetical protein B296_00032028 [Ensete ventricosum]|uniref:Uncharacterized protein n=1 Tax=Ensete ventricosum TaxID=4639 RepID=A0A426ZZ16_ENSVE|nr:hypothetical protein B296_00032028 [Ensete ventricosum]